jgi:demethoxyubiquinone hydroxylase (CLK1/Coq7/Cat5 family)
MATHHDSRKRLIKLLRSAYSGELAAAYAYRGHWKSLKPSPERTQIEKIETEEWLHRENVARWLKHLEAKPSRLREVIFWTIGRTLGTSCYISGWFMPMYFAGRLESQNVQEYIDAAEYAKELGMGECAEDMMEMSRVEGEHETFFRSTVAEHHLLPMMKRVFKWS